MRPAPPSALLLLACLGAAAAPAVLAAGLAQERGGAPQERPARPPAGGQEREPAPEPPPVDLAEADAFFAIADYDANGWISYREARDALQVDQARFFAFDTDRDGRIELDEFRKVYTDTVIKVGAFERPIPDPGRPAPAAGPLVGAPEPDAPFVPATRVEDVFGTIEPRDDGPDALPRPERLVGPVPSFRRLDHDDDGLITTVDLIELGRPLAVPVRVRALIAILDEDGDGGVSRAELYRSMQHARPAPLPARR